MLPEPDVLTAAVRARIPDTLPQQESSVAQWSDEITVMLELCGYDPTTTETLVLVRAGTLAEG